jgi:hypothetical protein
LYSCLEDYGTLHDDDEQQDDHGQEETSLQRFGEAAWPSGQQAGEIRSWFHCFLRSKRSKRFASSLIFDACLHWADFLSCFVELSKQAVGGSRRAIGQQQKIQAGGRNLSETSVNFLF